MSKKYITVSFLMKALFIFSLIVTMYSYISNKWNYVTFITISTISLVFIIMDLYNASKLRDRCWQLKTNNDIINLKNKKINTNNFYYWSPLQYIHKYTYYHTRINYLYDDVRIGDDVLVTINDDVIELFIYGVVEEIYRTNNYKLNNKLPRIKILFKKQLNFPKKTIIDDDLLSANSYNRPDINFPSLRINDGKLDRNGWIPFNSLSKKTFD